MKEVKFAGFDCVVKKTKYMNNNNLALVLLDKEDGEMVARVTINTEQKLPDDVALVKDYSENEGMLESIKNAGIVKGVIGYATLGFVVAPIVKFNLTDIEDM